MTKVEELRNGTIFAYELGVATLAEFTERIKNLIVSAHAAGYAECKGEGLERVQATFKEELAKARVEGAEQEREGGKREFDKLLEDDNYLRHYNDTLIEQINKLDNTSWVSTGPLTNASVLAPSSQNAKEREIQWLRSDIAALDRLLAGLPADHVIERLGFESKKKEDEERLAALAPKEPPCKS